MTMFKNISGINDILNSEGPILRLRERDNVPLNQHNLYIEGILRDGETRILCRISTETLRIYLNGRLRTSELFMVRSDENYIKIRRDKLKIVRFNSDLKYEITHSLMTGCCFYTDLPESMRSYLNPAEIMKVVDLFW